MSQRLKQFYHTEVAPSLKADFQYTSEYQIPHVTKIVVNRGVGEGSSNAKLLESCLDELNTLAGQKGIVTKSKKAIAGFKLREGVPVGVAVTLRGERMYAFLDRLIHLAFPRIRDFQGIDPQGFDGRGNYTLGFQEQLMFPELEYDTIDQVKGMDISIVTSAKTNTEGLALLTKLGLPFQTP
jgi:large subunit ribosomal protein L5